MLVRCQFFFRNSLEQNDGRKSRAAAVCRTLKLPSSFAPTAAGPASAACSAASTLCSLAPSAATLVGNELVTRALLLAKRGLVSLRKISFLLKSLLLPLTASVLVTLNSGSAISIDLNINKNKAKYGKFLALLSVLTD